MAICTAVRGQDIRGRAWVITGSRFPAGVPLHSCYLSISLAINIPLSRVAPRKSVTSLIFRPGHFPNFTSLTHRARKPITEYAFKFFAHICTDPLSDIFATIWFFIMCWYLYVFWSLVCPYPTWTDHLPFYCLRFHTASISKRIKCVYDFYWYK